MPRNINSATATALASTSSSVGIFVLLNLPAGALYVWSGMGNLSYTPPGSNTPITFTGVGVLGSVGTIGASTSVFAAGIKLTLEGVDPTTIGEALTGIPVGTGCTVWYGLLQSGSVVGALISVFEGLTDQVSIQEGVDTCTVTIDVESKLAQLQRNREYRYTDAQQQALYPGDNFLRYVAVLQNWLGTWGFKNNND